LIVFGLIIKPIFHLHRHAPWVSKMGAAKRVAVVQQKALVADVGRGQLCRPRLAKTLANSKIDRSMRRQVSGTITIEETRAIVQIAGYPRLPRQIRIEAEAQRVTLVVVEEEVAIARGWRKIRQPAA